MKVSISGTIVSPNYDDEYFASWIDKGIITPSSRVVSAIESATEPFDLYINSYGGDVFAGGEMMIAIQKAFIAGNVRSIEVGSIAASMAANIVASLAAAGAKIVGHRNSQLMFHGCYTETTGGAQHHEDVAESLRNINESVISDLNRVGIKECRAWFSEGREKWIGINEAVELKLIADVVESNASAPKDFKKTAARLAAFASTFTTQKDYEMNIDTSINEPVAEVAENPVEPVAEVAPVEASVETPVVDIEAKANELANERFAKLQAKHDKMISDLTKERDAALNDLTLSKERVTSLEASLAEAEAALASMRDQVAKAESNRAAVVASALAGAPKENNKVDHRAVLASLPTNKRAEYYKAHRAEIDR